MSKLINMGRASKETRSTRFGGPVLDGAKAFNPLTNQWEYKTTTSGNIVHPAPVG